MSSPVCEFCEGPTRLLLVKESSRVWFCDQCLTGFSSPPKSDPFDGKYFDYLLSNQHESDVQARARAEKVQRLSSPEHTLDVGAGAGTFARAMAQYGSAVEAVDISQTACSYLEEQGVVSHHGTLLSLNLSSTYDLITFWDSLECMDHAAEALTAARRLIQDGGLLVVQVPNHSWEMLRLARLVERVSEKAARSLLHVSSQRYHFTAAGIESLLRRTGFCAFDRDRGYLGVRLRLRHGIRTALVDVIESLYAIWARLRAEEAPLVYYCRPS